MPNLFDDPEGAPQAHPPTRVCPHCATQSQVEGEYCPRCGKAFARQRRSLGRRGTVLLVAALLLLVGGGAATSIGLQVRSDNRTEAAREKAQRIAAQEREERERRAEEEERLLAEAEEEQQALDAVEKSGRRQLEGSLRAAITKDARETVADGLLNGPILKSVCDPVGGGRDDLEARTGKYECMAVTEENLDGTMRGYTYDATINYDKYSYSWKLGPS